MLSSVTSGDGGPSPLTGGNTGRFGSSSAATGGLSGGLMLSSVTSGDGDGLPCHL